MLGVGNFVHFVLNFRGGLLTRLYVILQLFFKSKGIVSEEAYILFVRKNAIVVLIPKYGLEGTVFFEEKDKPKPRLAYDDEVLYCWTFFFGRKAYFLYQLAKHSYKLLKLVYLCPKSQKHTAETPHFIH